MKKLLFVAVVALTSFAACGSAKPAASTTTSASKIEAAAPKVDLANLKAPGEAAVGDSTTCPVSGETFVVTAESPKVEIEGKTYYTCCPHCVEKLKADPKKFLKI
jgi:YHS domain-containing protein